MPTSQPSVCPYLGVLEDPHTCLDYPSPWNVCHHARPAAVVRLSHQRFVCLGETHTQCPVFQSQQLAPLPVELRRR